MNNRIKDFYTAERGIFKIFSEHFPTRFKKIFGDVSASEMDIYTAVTFGNKICVHYITAENIDNVVLSVIAVMLDSWERIAETLNAEYTPTATGTETRTKTGTLQRTGNGNETILNAEKFFNDLEFSENERTGKTNTENNTDTYNITETISKSDNVQANINSEIYLRSRNNICKQIAETVIKAITIDIY